MIILCFNLLDELIDVLFFYNFLDFLINVYIVFSLNKIQYPTDKQSL
jgi:hypothetical protein